MARPWAGWMARRRPPPPVPTDRYQATQLLRLALLALTSLHFTHFHSCPMFWWSCYWLWEFFCAMASRLASWTCGFVLKIMWKSAVNFFFHLKCLNICTGSSSLFCYHQILVRFVIIKRNVVSPSTVIVVLKTLHYENFTNFDKVWQNLATISHLTKAINYNSIGAQHFSRVSVSVSDPVRFKTAGIRIQRYGSITLALKYILLCFSFVLAISLLGRWNGMQPPSPPKKKTLQGFAFPCPCISLSLHSLVLAFPLFFTTTITTHTYRVGRNSANN